MCSCYGEGLYIENNKECETIDISFFRRGFSGALLSWRERVRWCWNILSKGTPYTDELMLNMEEAKKVKEWLNSNVK